MSLDMLTIKDTLSKVGWMLGNICTLCTRMLIYMKDAGEAGCRENVEKANQFK